MEFTIHLETQIKRLAGVPSVRVQAEQPPTAFELVRTLARQQGDPVQSLLVDEHGELRRSVLVFLGDEHLPADRPVPEGTELTIMTPISGG